MELDRANLKESSIKDVQPEHKEHRIDGGVRAWSLVFAGFCINFVGLGYNYAFGVYQYEYEYKYPHATSLAISFIGSTCIALTLSCGLFVGRLAEVYGHRVVLLVGTVIYCGSLLAASFVNNIPALIVLQGVLNGVGGACLFIPATAAPCVYFKKRITIAIGIAACGSGCGGIAWSFIIRAITSRLSTNWALRISSFICAAILVAVSFLIKTPRSKRKAIKEGSFRQSLQLFKVKRFYLLYLSSALTVFGYATPFFYLPLYIQQRAGANQNQGALISSIMSVGMVCGRFILAFLSDYKVGKFNVVVLGMIMASILQLILWNLTSSNLRSAFAFSFLYGFFSGGYIGLFPSTLTILFDPDKVSSITGIFFSSELIGQLVGPPISGAILGASSGDYIPLISFSGGIMFVGSLFAVAARFHVDKRWLITL